MRRLVGVVVLACGLLATASSPMWGSDSADSGPRTLRQVVSNVSTEHIASDIKRLAAFGTRSSLSDVNSPTRGVGAARAWIAAQMRAYSAQSGGRLRVELQTFTASVSPATGGAPIEAERVRHPVAMANVIATLPGDDAGRPAQQAQPSDRRVFIVGGHYDSRASDVMDPQSDAPGANDDGSGVAVVLECARVLSRYHFHATLKFIAFEGEEQGLLGSEYTAGAARSAGEQIAGVLDNDIVGGDNTRGQANSDRVRLFSEGVPAHVDAQELARLAAVGGENDSPSRELARFSAALAREYVTALQVELEYRRDRYMRGGDHIPFNERGFSAVRFVDYFENYDHQHQNVRMEEGRQYGDLPEFTNPEYTARVARINAVTLAALAGSLPAPEHVYFAPELERGTTLRWDAVPGATGYIILVRPTAAAQWERSVRVSSTSAHIPESKDNFFIAIATLNAEGQAGLPAIPTMPPRR